MAHHCPHSCRPPADYTANLGVVEGEENAVLRCPVQTVMLSESKVNFLREQ